MSKNSVSTQRVKLITTVFEALKNMSMILNRQLSASVKLWLGLIFILFLITFFMLFDTGISEGQSLDFDYLLPKRLLRLATLVVGGVCLAVSAISFQTVVGNRILVPSIMGYEAVFLLWQALLLFIVGAQGFATLGASGNFLISLILMSFYSWLLFRWLLPYCNNDMFIMLLFGFVLTMVISTITQFIQLRISPGEFSVFQGVSYTSFNRATEQTLFYSSAVILVVLWLARKWLPILDVMALGAEQALSLGVDYPKFAQLILAIIGVLVAVSTSLIGPTVFMGIFVAHIAYALAGSFHHKYILPTGCLVAIALFLIAQILVEHVFNYKTTVSILVNLVCGSYFLLLTLRSRGNL